MSSLGPLYPLTKNESANDLTFFFVSEGRQPTIKLIEYVYVGKLFGYDLYNLGFGDYDIEKDTIIDIRNSNNGDHYKVFHTVLSSVPVFFNKYPEAVLMVQGRDSRSEFVDACRPACRKRCSHECKNFRRRINIYNYYV